MKARIRRIWQNEIFRAVLLIAATVAGVVFPTDFLLQIDGYLIYLRPLELLPVFAWAWTYYALLGLVLGLGFIFTTVFLAILCRKKPSAGATAASFWLSLSISVLTLVRGGKLWMEANQLDASAWWLSQHQGAVVLMVLVICALAIRYRRIEQWRFPQALYLCAACGGGLSVVLAFASLAFEVTPVAPRHALAPAAPIGKQPNIILLTIDAFAANHASLYGYSRPTTPHLEKLAEQASVFERYYANSNFTTPSVNSFINGVRPWTHRINQGLARVDASWASQGLIARLKQAGYETGAVWTNPIAAPFHNQNEGWTDRMMYGRIRSSYEWIGSVMTVRFPAFAPVTILGIYAKSLKLFDRLLVLVGLWSPVDQHDPGETLSVAKSLLDSRQSAVPMFLWIHLLPPHDPYAAPAPFAGRFDPSPLMLSRFNSSPPYQFLALVEGDNAIAKYAGRYDEALLYTDSHIGMFVDWLKARHLYQDTLIVISADHGESFTRNYGGHGGPLLHDDLIHIPLIIKEPGQNSGRRLDTLAEQIDLMPTILDLAGVPIAGLVEGKSLAPALQGRNLSGPVFSMNFEQNSRFGELKTGSIAMIEQHWKYVHYRGRIQYRLMPDLSDALYDLSADPDERTNLITTQSAVAAKMRAAIEDQLRLHSKTLP